MTTQSKSQRKKRRRTLRMNNAILQLAQGIEEQLNLKLPICKKRRKPKQLLTTEQAAKVLGRKKHTLENWRSIGEGPPFLKTGGRILYQRSDLLKYLKDRKYNSTSAYCAHPQQNGEQS